MSHNPCEGSHNPCEQRCRMPMSAALEMRDIVREAAEPLAPGASVKAAIGAAARRLGLAFPRARDHWYGRARLVTAEEADALRARRRELAAARLRRLEADIAAQRALIAAMSQPDAR